MSFLGIQTIIKWFIIAFCKRFTDNCRRKSHHTTRTQLKAARKKPWASRLKPKGVTSLSANAAAYNSKQY